MIAYYRIYYDQQIQNFSGLKWIYIHKPLPSYEITQEELANFINENEKDVSFKCELNRYIYATARYIPWKYETRIPIERQCLYDLFIFPTPTKNKTPGYVTPTSIKTAQSFVLRQKVEALDAVTSTILDKVLIPINTTWSGVEFWYKKTKTGTLKVSKPNAQGVFEGGYEKKWLNYFNKTSGEFNRLVVEKLTMKNVLQTQKFIQIHYSMNPEVRKVGINEQNGMTDSERNEVKADFTDSSKYRFIDMMNPGKHSYFAPWIRTWYSVNRSDMSTYRLRSSRAMDAMVLKPEQNTYWNFQLFMDNWAVRYNGHSPSYTTDYTLFNILTKDDMSVLPWEYLSDTSYYSLFNKIWAYEHESPMHLLATDSSSWYRTRDWVWTMPDTTNIYTPATPDSTSFWWKYISQANPTQCDNTENWHNVGGQFFCFQDKQPRGQIERENKLLPVWSKSYIVRDKSNTTYGTKRYHVVYTVRYLKKETIDWLIDNTFNWSYDWFAKHIKDLTNVQFNQYWVTYSFILDTNNNMSNKTRTNVFSVTDQTIFSYTSDDLTTIDMNQYRIMYNYNENSDKWNVVKCTERVTYSRSDATNYSGYWHLPYSHRNWLRRYQVMDSTLNVIADFTTTSTVYSSRAGEYTIPNTVVDSTVMATIVPHWTEDLTYFAAVDFVLMFALGYEDGLIVNELPKRGNIQFLFRDIMTTPYVIKYSTNYQIPSLYVSSSWFGVKTNENITASSTDGKLYKWAIYTPNPGYRYDTGYPPYDKSSSKSLAWKFYRNGSGSYTSYTKYFYWDDEYMFDHYDGMLGYYTFILDATVWPYSDITAWYSPNPMFYIAKPGKGGQSAESPITTSLKVFDHTPGTSYIGKYTYGYIYSQSDTSAYGKRTDSCHSPGQFETRDIDPVDVYYRVMESLMRMTPYDLLIADSYSPGGSRVLTNLWPWHKGDDTVECTLEWYDATTCVPTTILITDRVTKKQNWRITSVDMSAIADRWRYQNVWFMRMIKPHYPASGITHRLYINTCNNYLRSFQLDSTTDLIFHADDCANNFSETSDGVQIYWNYTTSSTANYWNIVRRTPNLHLIGRDSTYFRIKQNAVLDLMGFHMATYGNGYLLPKRNLATTVFDNTTLASRVIPYWNMAKDTSINDTTVSINVLDTMLYAGDITVHESLEINPKMINRFASPDLTTTRDYGYPMIALDRGALIPDDGSCTLSMQQLLDTTGYQHLHYIDIEPTVKSSDLLIKSVDHTVDMEFDFEDSTFSFQRTESPRNILSNTIYSDYNSYNPVLHEVKDFTSYYTYDTATISYPQYYYGLKTGDYTSVNIFQACNLKYTDYTFENSTYAANTDQSTKYFMSRIQVNSGNLIMLPSLQTFHTPSPVFGDFTVYMLNQTKYTPTLTKGELLYLMQTFATNKTFVMRLRWNWFLIDGTNKDRMYVAFVHGGSSGVLTNVGSFTMAEWDKVLPVQAWASNQYFTDTWLVDSTASQIVNFMNKLKAANYSPSGNMYMISDFDSNFLELVYIDILDVLT